MSWFRLDDAFFSHPKAIQAGLQGRMLFIAAGCYACKHLTDGRIIASALPIIAAEAGVTNPKKIADLLVSLGLLEKSGGDYVIHDFLFYNRTKSEVTEGREEISKKRSEAGKKGMQSRWGGSKTITNDNKTDNKAITPTQTPLVITERLSITTNPVGTEGVGGEVNPGDLLTKEQLAESRWADAILLENPDWSDYVSAAISKASPGNPVLYRLKIVRRLVEEGGPPGIKKTAPAPLSKYEQMRAESEAAADRWEIGARKRAAEALAKTGQLPISLNIPN